MKRPGLILFWWLFSLTSGLVFIIVLASLGLWTPCEAASTASAQDVGVDLAGAGITAVSLWLLILVIRLITSRQSQKFRAIQPST